MGVLVVAAIVKLLHQPGRRVAQVQRDGFGDGVLHVGTDGAVGGIDSVGFRRKREIDDGLREGQLSFGMAEEVHGIARGEAEVERLGRGEADVLDGHANDAAGDVHGVFAGFEHAGQPIERGVCVGVAHALVQRGDDVVVLLTFFVVEQDALLQRFGGHRLIDDFDAAAVGQFSSDLQSIQRGAGIAAGVSRYGRQRVFSRGQLQLAESALLIGQCAFEQPDDLRLFQRSQRVDATTRE